MLNILDCENSIGIRYTYVCHVIAVVFIYLDDIKRRKSKAQGSTDTIYEDSYFLVCGAKYSSVSLLPVARIERKHQSAVCLLHMLLFNILPKHL